MFNRPQNKAERLATRAIYIPKTAKLVSGPAGGAVYIYSDTSRDGRARFNAMYFVGSAAKPANHICYSTEQRRTENVAQFHANIKASAERKLTRRAENKAWVNPLTVGEILHTCWGYDQTNTEFYVVTKVSGKRVWVAEISADYEATGFMSGKTWPAMPIRIIGEETMHTAQPCGERGASVKINESATAWQEEGRSHYTSSYA